MLTRRTLIAATVAATLPVRAMPLVTFGGPYVVPPGGLTFEEYLGQPVKAIFVPPPVPYEAAPSFNARYVWEVDPPG